jgi:DNA repair exonuclease SbcCD ATPase subunit
MTEIELYKQIVQIQDELVVLLDEMNFDTNPEKSQWKERRRLFKELAVLKRQLKKLNQCKNIIEKVKEAWTPDKRSFEEAEKDKAYLNECIEKATPNLSKIKDVDKELAEIKGQGWICPRCGKVHSWLSMECDCKPAGTWSITYDPSDFPSIH